MKKQGISVYRLCVIAFAVCINLVGGQLALMLRLPIYLDCIGTLFVGALLGPFYGMLPNLLSGVIMGFTTDIYSLYFAPVGMIIGFMSGLVFKKRGKSFGWPFGAAFLITLPGTIVSSIICAVLFGGLTSSGSSLIIQFLSKIGMPMTASVFVVQIITDYADKLIGVLLVLYLLKALPTSLLREIKNK